MTDLKMLSEKHYDYMVEMRRHFHKYPELSTQEKETSRRICEELDKIGLPYNVYEDYTVVAIVDGGNPGKTVLIRGDIDALPLQEETGAEENLKGARTLAKYVKGMGGADHRRKMYPQ